MLYNGNADRKQVLSDGMRQQGEQYGTKHF